MSENTESQEFEAQSEALEAIDAGLESEDFSAEDLDDEFDSEDEDDDEFDSEDEDDVESDTTDYSQTPGKPQIAMSALPITGEPRVDDALARLSDLTNLPVHEHVAVFEDVQRRLHETLADLSRN